jgi:hyperpolarization activated cyclic nucleotide-gated potassium channel 2
MYNERVNKPYLKTYEEAQNYKWLILPDNRKKMYWDIFIGLLLIYTAIFLPFFVCFDVDTSQTMDIVIDLSFMIDIIVTFFSSVKELDRYIVDKKIIAKNYIKTWFFIDILTTFPFQIFE